MLKEIINLLEQLDILIDYIEPPLNEVCNPTKVELLQGNKKVTTKEAILKNLYEYFKKFKFLKDLQLYDSRIQFWMPYYKDDWLCEWKDTSKALSNAKLNVYKYNSTEGYIVEIS